MRLLVADDDDMAREMLTEILTAVGYEVDAVPDGLQAWERVIGEDIRLLVIDWEMPGMSGIELCKKIRSEDLPAYVYVILLTGRDRTQDILTGLSAGADDFIVKPCNVTELQLRVRAGERMLSLETRDMAIFAMAKLAESRDPETGEHLERIQVYCQLLAEQLREQPKFAEVVTDAFVRMIFSTSPLHDIGKIGIPDAILLKPGRLNNEEFEYMKLHASIGAETLDAALQRYPSAPFLQIARDIVVGHHERFDGSGYPAGLVGDAIPLAARIVALADMYDALTSKRVYKDAFAHAIAHNMIIEESGRHFDPDIVDAYLACEQRILQAQDLINRQLKNKSIQAKGEKT